MMHRRLAALPVLVLFASVFALGQYGTVSKDELIAYTEKNTYERFEDGRPRVPDNILERMKEVSIEEAWEVLMKHGYRYQFSGDWMNVHPERVLVGRVVTACFMPQRPDIEEVTMRKGKADGRIGAQNSWVIDTLKENDVIVVDLFGKIKEGTFAGDNLGTSIATKSKTGMIIEGGIRDLDGVFAIPNFSVFIRGVDPTALRGTTLMGINVPIRIGEVTVLPGDVVLGRREGIIFVPPHLAEEVVTRSEDVRLRDEFGHLRLREGKYTPGQIDREWTDEIKADFEQWKKQRRVN